MCHVVPSGFNNLISLILFSAGIEHIYFLSHSCCCTLLNFFLEKQKSSTTETAAVRAQNDDLLYIDIDAAVEWERKPFF